jgi:ring-1,2-phenylacetyl-CoA epoxidase subunit PaaE
MKFYTLRVIDIHEETHDCLTIIFKQPGLKHIKYLAGQYLSLIFRINGRRYIRPYSFSSAPGVEETLNITIKRVPGGVVSNHILDKVKVGDVIEVMEPMGDFILTENASKPDSHIYLWGAGSGITPLISIAKYALHHNKLKSVNLVYGNRSYENIIFRNEISTLKQNFKSKFSARHFITRPFIDKLNPDIVQGRITAQQVKSILTQKETALNNAFHYICGPAGLKESVKSVLSELRVEDSHVFSEDFEIKRDPNEFENIFTRNVLIKKNQQIFNVEVIKGKSILEAGLDSFIDLSYSCQTGNCLVCKGQLIKGEIKMIGLQKIPEELTPDECLLCCSFPLNDAVEIATE